MAFSHETTVIGHLAADALQKNSGENNFITYRVGSTTKFKDRNDQMQEETEWFDCITSGGENVLAFLTKGKQVMVRGRVKADAYTNDKGEVVPVLRLRVQASNLTLLGGSGERTESAPKRAATPEPAASTGPAPFEHAHNVNNEPEDLPF